MGFDYVAFRAEFKRLKRMSEYDRANARADAVRRQRLAMVSDWWQKVEWLDWLDEHSAVSRPTERMCMVRMSPSVHRQLRMDADWWTVEMLKFAYGVAHDLPLAALLGKRGRKLEFVEVGGRDSQKVKAVEVAA